MRRRNWRDCWDTGEPGLSRDEERGHTDRLIQLLQPFIQGVAEQSCMYAKPVSRGASAGGSVGEVLHRDTAHVPLWPVYARDIRGWGRRGR